MRLPVSLAGTRPISAPVKDLVYVAAHELGHSLGLLEHSNLAGTMMYVKYSPQRHLHAEDIARIRALYPPGLGRDWVHVPGNAIDMAIGADGTICHVGTKQTGNGGYALYRWNGGGWDEYPRTAAATVAVDPRGLPWRINTQLAMFRRV